MRDTSFSLPYAVQASISLESTPPSPIMAGDSLTLTCYVSLPAGVNGSPFFHWEGPEESLVPAEPISSGGMIFSHLTFDVIAVSQAGLYKCNISLGGFISTTINITVLGMSNRIGYIIFSLIITNVDEVIFLEIVESDDVLVSWIAISGVPVTVYRISYSNMNNICFNDSGFFSADNETLNHTLKDLQEHTQYLIKVAVVHENRVIGSNKKKVLTKPTGKLYV